MSIFPTPRPHCSTPWNNLRVGLLGGSFNPPHIGHLHISKVALKALHLDAIWWLVTPQNPLKSSKDLLPISERVELSRTLIDHPKIVVTDIEDYFQTTYSFSTMKSIKKHFPHTNFVWITGMDNAHHLHLWEHWKDLLDSVCMAHITRHPAVKLVQQCPSRMLQTQRHVVLDSGGRLPLTPRTTYWLLQKKMMNISSTEIRMRQKKQL